MNKSTKKCALESTEKKNEDVVIAAIQFNDWCNISNTKRIRSTTTSAERQLLEFRKFGDDSLPIESGIVFNEEEIKNLIQLIPAIDSNQTCNKSRTARVRVQVLVHRFRVQVQVRVFRVRVRVQVH